MENYNPKAHIQQVTYSFFVVGRPSLTGIDPAFPEQGADRLGLPIRAD
jgi:hypothetical protein